MQIGKLREKIMDVNEILTAVFGDSDSEAEEDNNLSLPSSSSSSSSTTLLYKVLSEDGQKKTWEKIELVEGLWICRDFLSSRQQEVLLMAIQTEGWFLDPQHNQAMRFGQLPNWAVDLASLVRHAVSAYDNSSSTCFMNCNSNESQITSEESFRGPLTHQIVQRKPLFDQMTLNSYEPGEGISDHVDLLRFEDGIAIVSLLSARVMTFTKLDSTKKVSEHTNSISEIECPTKRNYLTFQDSCNKRFLLLHPKAEVPMKVPILLSPGNLLLMSGEARYQWTHEIVGDEKQQLWNGSKLEQRRRISVTLRRLCPARD